MSTYVSPIANGARTDHPVPGLPFVDDSHVPVEDPEAVKAIGRHHDTGTWGRCDYADDKDGEWIAFTTDAKNPTVGWVVRYHPTFGRSVLLYRDSEVADAYGSVHFVDKPLLSRVGGYWWTGAEWYRPGQVIDWAQHRFVRRAVVRPAVITAADLLDGSGQPELGRPAGIMQLGGEQTATELAAYQLQGGATTGAQWRHDLALWAAQRPADARPLQDCVVTVTAPELMDTALLSVEQVATKAGLAASTLRAYLARDLADIPSPQAFDGPRKRWAAPVVADWIEQRRASPGHVAAALTRSTPHSADHGIEAPTPTFAPGVQTLIDQLTKIMLRTLWSDPGAQRRWSRPFRNETAVRAVSHELAWFAAPLLESTVPFKELAAVLQDSVRVQMIRDYKMIRDDNTGGSLGYFDPVLDPQTGTVLGWFIRHQPHRVQGLFGEIIGTLERTENIPRAVTKRSLRDAIETHGGFGNNDKDQLREFLDRAFPPDK